MQAAATKEDAGDLFERGFRLAYFLLPHRPLAVQVLTEAMNRLNARCRQENKRAYWRDKYLKRWGSKISRADGDTLQWLIYFAAEQYEKQLEERGDFTTEDLVIRYVKSLIQTTSGMSSFYVAVGLHRLLHNYSTSEVQRMYELITDRYLGGDEYRRAKRMLMNKLSDRFSKTLKTATVARGEMRFEPGEDQSCWISLVRACLEMFIPWSTSCRCMVPANDGSGSVLVPRLLSGIDAGVSPDSVEMNRCHALIDPVCFSRVTKLLAFDPSESRLALPKFHKVPGGQNKPAGPRYPTGLSSHERQAIQAHLGSESSRRKKAPPHILRIGVDGTELTRLDPRQESEMCLDLRKGAKLIEVWTEDTDGSLLLATHLLAYSQADRIVSSMARIEIGKAKLDLVVSANESNDGEWSASLRVIYTKPLPRVRGSWFSPPLPSLQYAAMALLLVGTGWILGSAKNNRELTSERARMERAIVEAKVSSAQSTESLRAGQTIGVVTQRLIPYELGTRGVNSSDSTRIFIPPGSALINLELPISTSNDRTYNAVLRLFPDRTVVLSEEIHSSKGDREQLIVFPVPAALALRNREYMVELNTTNAPEQREYLGTFMFSVIKEQ